MKNALITLALGFTLVPASFSQASAPTLADYMKSMKTLVQQIVKDLPDTTKTKTTAQAVVDFRTNVINALGFTPDSITNDPNLTPAQVYEKQLEYQRQLLKLLPVAIDLEEGILDSDSAKAQLALKTLGDLQKEGHKIFNP